MKVLSKKFSNFSCFLVFESPQKNLFIPDLKIESNEKNSKKQTNELISKKLNIVEEDLLEIERRHSFDVHLELGEKFKHFYQLYIVGAKIIIKK